MPIWPGSKVGGGNPSFLEMPQKVSRGFRGFVRLTLVRTCQKEQYVVDSREYISPTFITPSKTAQTFASRGFASIRFIPRISSKLFILNWHENHKRNYSGPHSIRQAAEIQCKFLGSFCQISVWILQTNEFTKT